MAEANHSSKDLNERWDPGFVSMWMDAKADLIRAESSASERGRDNPSLRTANKCLWRLTLAGPLKSIRIEDPSDSTCPEYPQSFNGFISFASFLDNRRATKDAFTGNNSSFSTSFLEKYN
eukprot:Gregarina_sp_Poly_1__5289@NODE_279_length_10190_cov_93_504495_g243_i0_p12_GENE_NODE_279_length_10190_cov_93_504495_g243_i0NODE_279_length_10190_cov_93_504495_g243_i0_p12_ORF_typecomplete_len120_score11_99Peptidase_M75/PF09375_10/0_1_NODE_279_length_10190_cov_93_504495_g243_i078528211